MNIDPIKDDAHLARIKENRARFADSVEVLEASGPGDIDAEAFKAILDSHRSIIEDFDKEIATYEHRTAK